MKAKTITYEKLFNLGDYEHEKIGITLEVEDNDNPNDVLKRAIDFCHERDVIRKQEKNIKEEEHKKAVAIMLAKNKILDRRGHSIKAIKEAKQLLKDNNIPIPKKSKDPF